jgi:CRISPR-associated protein (TIGR02584 family)
MVPASPPTPKEREMSAKPPHDFPRRILICAAGLTPQVVTETVYALAVAQPTRFVPTEVHVVSTAVGCNSVRLNLLAKDTDHFFQLRRDYELPPIRFDESCLHVIHDVLGSPVEDIRSPADNTAAADALTALVAELTRDDQAAVHVSIAGGRKTMVFYGGYALSLYGRPQDRLSHVLVSKEFENLHSFFYPSPEPRTIYDKEHRAFDASLAEVTLAEIPFVRMREDLPEDLLSRRTSFSEAVAAAERMRSAESLVIRLAKREIVCNGIALQLSAQNFGVYAWIAHRLEEGMADGGAVSRTEFNRSAELRNELRQFVHSIWPNEVSSEREAWDTDRLGDPATDFGQWLDEKCSRIRGDLRRVLGATGAARFEIASWGGRGATMRGLNVESERIRFE